MIDCNLTRLENGKWWCPASGCDDDKKRLLPGNYHRNCQSPEVNAEAKRRKEEAEAKLVVCRECPIGMWDDEDNHCQKYSHSRCGFNAMLTRPFFRCEHWK